MKRFEIRMSVREHQAISRAAEIIGITASEFARQAMTEKQVRNAVLEHIENARTELEVLVRELREETGRIRRDLMDDQQRGLELMRQEIAKSMKKNEELQKTFVMALAGQPARPKPSGAARPSGDGPMAIPG